MHRYILKLALTVSVLFALCAEADTHVWKATGRVNDWDWNEPGNYDSSLGASGVPSAGDIVQLPDTADISVLGTDSVMRMPEGLRKEYREMAIRKTPNATVRILRSNAGTRWMMKTPLREKRTVGRRICLNRTDLLLRISIMTTRPKQMIWLMPGDTIMP